MSKNLMAKWTTVRWGDDKQAILDAGDALLGRVEQLEADNEALRGKDDGTEKCLNCGSMVEQVWNAPDELWDTLSGYPQDNGILCIRCFDRGAQKQGVFLYWSCQPNQFLHKENEALKEKSESADRLMQAIKDALQE